MSEPRQVQPHTPGSGYHCVICDRPHIAGCNAITPCSHRAAVAADSRWHEVGAIKQTTVAIPALAGEPEPPRYHADEPTREMRRWFEERAGTSPDDGGSEMLRIGTVTASRSEWIAATESDAARVRAERNFESADREASAAETELADLQSKVRAYFVEADAKDIESVSRYRAANATLRSAVEVKP